MPLSAAHLLPPVTPSKIICVGRNYRDHVKELGNDMPVEPLIFYKRRRACWRRAARCFCLRSRPAWTLRASWASSSASASQAELGCRLARRDRGYTLADDVSARDLQKKDGQWTRAKGFDTFLPLGPLVSDEINPWLA